MGSPPYAQPRSGVPLERYSVDEDPSPHSIIRSHLSAGASLLVYVVMVTSYVRTPTWRNAISPALLCVAMHVME